MPPPLILSDEPPKSLLPLDEAAESEKREIRRLLRFTSWRHPIHKSVDAKTGELMEAPDAACLCKILRDSPDYQWRERTTAALALRRIEMSPTQARYAARVLGDVMNGSETIDTNAKRQREWQEFWRQMRMGGATLCGVFVLNAILENHLLPDSLTKFFVWYGMGAALTCPVWILGLATLNTHRRARLRSECAVTLRHLKLPESIRALAVLAQSQKYYASIAQEALLEILPLLTPEHYGRLEAGTVSELCGLLRIDSFPRIPVFPIPLCGAAIDALAKIGDGSAVKPMKRFIEKCQFFPMLEKAADILPILLARQAQEEAHSTLLRGASAPAVPEKELLRAASSTPEAAPGLLLRASRKE